MVERGSPPAPRVPFRRRSRSVAWAKVILPLAALALLSTVFLLAREPGGPVDIPYARLEEIAREPRMDQARLTGVAEDGTRVALSAERVRLLPGRIQAFALQAPRLETETPQGAVATLTAAEGEVDAAARALDLSGGVRIESSAGYTMDTPALAADLRTGTLTAGAVVGTAPLGRIEAGGMTLSQGGGNGDARLVFNGGVRVLYQPQNPSSSEAP